MTNRIGEYVTTTTAEEPIRAYVPKPLPPDPPLALSRLIGLSSAADQALGRLDGIGGILPAPDLFVFMYVHKEALLSSQIEGTQSSLSELLLFEDGEPALAPVDDVQEVSNYIAAMDHGLGRLKGGFPLSLRLIREMHAKLLAGGRGNGKQPGEFRTTQNWIGGSRPGNAIFVPPPPHRLMECLGDLELFLHNRAEYPPLIHAALAHLQFETIHPFLDGNGRLGRLLITLLLCEAKVLAQPMLYLSLYFKTNRTRYYDLLQSVRATGDWETWVEFFLTGVAETSTQGVETARRLLALNREDQAAVASGGSKAAVALRLLGLFQRRPVLSIPNAAELLGSTQPTTQKNIDLLIGKSIIRERTGRKRNRVYEYSRYLRILDEGTEPIRP